MRSPAILPLFEAYMRTRGPKLTLPEYFLGMGLAMAESLMIVTQAEREGQTWMGEVYQAWEDSPELGRPMRVDSSVPQSNA